MMISRLPSSLKSISPEILNCAFSKLNKLGSIFKEYQYSIF